MGYRGGGSATTPLLDSFNEDPSDVTALYNRGVAYSKLDHLNAAIEDFTGVLKLDRNHVQAAYSRAACYNAQGQLMKAIEDYNLALMMDKGEGGGTTGGGGGTPRRSSIGAKSPVGRRRGSMAVGVDA
jgi:tetratricopeptide (TPR) repeat protein